MLGLSATDGRLIRTSDEPTTAKIDFDWYDAHSEALVRSVELRQQKWVVKQRELEMIAAKNYLLPQLDAVAQYRWNGQGNFLIYSSNGVPNAAGSMSSGAYPNWQLGLNFSFPFGFRKERAGVRNAALTLVKERKVLQDMELELSHLLANAFRELSVQYRLSQTQYDRWAAAQRETKDAAALYDAGKVTLDFVLDAQRRLADSESSFYRAVVDYNLAIATIHYRKGSLLEYDGVYLAEGPWPAKAYFDAERRATGPRRGTLYRLRLHHAEGPQRRAVRAACGNGGHGRSRDSESGPGSQSPSSPTPTRPRRLRPRPRRRPRGLCRRRRKCRRKPRPAASIWANCSPETPRRFPAAGASISDPSIWRAPLKSPRTPLSRPHFSKRPRQVRPKRRTAGFRPAVPPHQPPVPRWFPHPSAPVGHRNDKGAQRHTNPKRK